MFDEETTQYDLVKWLGAVCWKWGNLEEECE
jgi:hypothetical protein